MLGPDVVQINIMVCELFLTMLFQAASVCCLFVERLLHIFRAAKSLVCDWVAIIVMLWKLIVTMAFEVASVFCDAIGLAEILSEVPSSAVEFLSPSIPMQFLHIFRATLTLMCGWICITVELWKLPFIPVLHVMSGFVTAIDIVPGGSADTHEEWAQDRDDAMKEEAWTIGKERLARLSSQVTRETVEDASAGEDSVEVNVEKGAAIDVRGAKLGSGGLTVAAQGAASIGTEPEAAVVPKAESAADAEHVKALEAAVPQMQRLWRMGPHVRGALRTVLLASVRVPVCVARFINLG